MSDDHRTGGRSEDDGPLQGGMDAGNGHDRGDDPSRPSGSVGPRRELPDMTRERARTERRDLDKERGEPVAGGASRGGPRALRRSARPIRDWATRPKILITNDDGIESRGLLALKQALDVLGDTTVVAPDTNQSAVGHQKTLMRPLRVRERTLGDGSIGYSVDGSPTDAVSLAFLGYFRHGFDLVASGINYGANLGDDITYSGTVSAAMEAVINGCPGFAISQEYYEHPDFSLASHAALAVARNILEHGLSPGELINVNVPAVPPEECEGFEVTRLGKRVYQDELIERVDPLAEPRHLEPLALLGRNGRHIDVDQLAPGEAVLEDVAGDGERREAGEREIRVLVVLLRDLEARAAVDHRLHGGTDRA